jgi:hypothetical protein
MTPHRRRPTFAEVVAEEKSAPRIAPEPLVGPHGGLNADGKSWADPAGNRYELVSDKLDPLEALTLARGGALIVYDSCGCGGDQGCRLDWLSSADVARLAMASPPVVGRPRTTWGRLAHWRSAQGQDLIETALNVRWGDRISY